MKTVTLSHSTTYAKDQIEIIPLDGYSDKFNWNAAFKQTYGLEFNRKVYCIAVSPIPADFYSGFAIDPRDVDLYFLEFNKIDKVHNKLQFIVRIEDKMPDEFTVYYDVYDSKEHIFEIKHRILDLEEELEKLRKELKQAEGQ